MKHLIHKFKDKLLAMVAAILALVLAIVPVTGVAKLCERDSQLTDSTEPQTAEKTPEIKKEAVNNEEIKVEVIHIQPTSWEEIPLDADLQTFIVKECEKANIRPSIIFAMCWRESNYKADEIGDDGNAFGLLQIWPRWHYERMTKLSCTDLLNPYHNITVGMDYLAELLEKYDGDITKTLTAYNRGSYNGTVTEYALSVINEAERLDSYVLH